MKNKQLQPVVLQKGGTDVWSGIPEKCQVEHTSVEGRQRCQGALMQRGRCFSNEDTQDEVWTVKFRV